MVTPELQKYIGDSRMAGMTDEQIKSALLSQGWLEQDINSGLHPDQTSTPAASITPNAKKIIIAVIIIFAILPALGWAGIMGFTAWKYKNYNINLNNDGPYHNSSTNDLFNPDKDSIRNAKLCGEWPGNANGNISTMARVAQHSSSNPFPSYVPLFPNAKIVASAKGGEGPAARTMGDNSPREVIILYLCSDDSVRQVAEFYDKHTDPELGGMNYFDIKEMSQAMSYGLTGYGDATLNIWQGHLPDKTTVFADGSIDLQQGSIIIGGDEYPREMAHFQAFDYQDKTIIMLSHIKN